MSDTRAEQGRKAIASHGRMGLVLVAALALVVGVWGATAKISGAVVAPGRLAAETSVKPVQHKEGGIVSELLVHEGDRVKEGALLLRLDATVPQANLAIASDQLMQLTARLWRLQAERDGAATITVPPDAPTDPKFAAMLQSERRLLETRRILRQQKKAQLAEQIGQAGTQVDGLNAQIASQVGQEKLIQGELAGIRSLYAKGLSPLSRLNALEREGKRLDGERGQLTAQIAETQTRVSQIKLQILQVDSEQLAEVMGDLKDTEIKTAQLREQKITLEDQLRRTEVRAPASGHVQQMQVHGPGAVVAPGETMMLIVPDNDELIVEARVDPQHIDEVRAGQPAHVRFTSFSARTTPEIPATVDRVSADTQTDQKTGVSYYVARLKLNGATLPSSMRSRLESGMPAEVHMTTVSRPVLSYFLKPLTDQMHRTFKED